MKSSMERLRLTKNDHILKITELCFELSRPVREWTI